MRGSLTAGHRWITDPRFATTESRMVRESTEALGALIDEALRPVTDELLEKMQITLRVYSGLSASLEEIFEDPQIIHNETILEFNAGWEVSYKPNQRRDFIQLPGPARRMRSQESTPKKCYLRPASVLRK